jgi:hypothetical protein
MDVLGAIKNFECAVSKSTADVARNGLNRKCQDTMSRQNAGLEK